MKVSWIMPNPPTERELEILKEIHGADLELEHINPEVILVRNKSGDADIEATKALVATYTEGFIYADSVLLFFALVGTNPNLGDGNFWATFLTFEDNTVDVAYVTHFNPEVTAQNPDFWKEGWRNPRFVPGKYKKITRCGAFNLLEKAIAGNCI